MIVTKITDHVQQALDQLMEQYKSRPRVVALVTAIAQHVQKLEDALYPLDQYRQLAFAYGAQLDAIGELVGLKRNGLDDNTYFVLLLGTIGENFSDTTSLALLNIVQTVFEGTTVFIKDPNSSLGAALPAQVSFGVGNSELDPSLYPIVEQIIQKALGAAISLTYLSTFNAGGAFACAGPQAWVKGFGAYSYAPDPTVGGPFCKLVYSAPTH